MSNTSEYEQQQFWEEEFKKCFWDELILGESYIQITKDGLKRIDPLFPEIQKLYDIISSRLEEDLINHIDPNKSYLPENYIGGIDPYDKSEESKSFGISKDLLLPKIKKHN